MSSGKVNVKRWRRKKFIATEDMVLVDKEWMEEAELADSILDPEGHDAAEAQDTKVIQSGKLVETCTETLTDQPGKPRKSR